MRNQEIAPLNLLVPQRLIEDQDKVQSTPQCSCGSQLISREQPERGPSCGFWQPRTETRHLRAPRLPDHVDKHLVCLPNQIWRQHRSISLGCHLSILPCQVLCIHYAGSTDEIPHNCNLQGQNSKPYGTACIATQICSLDPQDKDKLFQNCNLSEDQSLHNGACMATCCNVGTSETCRAKDLSQHRSVPKTE